MFPTFRNKLPNKTTLRVLTVTGLLCLVALPISATTDMGYIFNSFSFLIWGVLVMWMLHRVHHAGIWYGTYEERICDLFEEPWPLLDCLHYLLHHRL